MVGCRLYSRGNGDLLQEDVCQHTMPPRIAAVSAPAPKAGHYQPTPQPYSQTVTDKSGSVSCGGSLFFFSWVLVHIRFCLCPPKISVSPILWKFYNQIPQTFQTRFPENSLERLMLKLKLQYFGHLMQRGNSLEKTLMLGKIEGRRRGWQRMRWLDSITDSMDMSVSQLQEIDSKGQGSLACCSLQGHRVGDDWAPEQQQQLNTKKNIFLRTYNYML